MGFSDLFLHQPAPGTHGEATERGADGVTVYWRPGCSFCQMLRARVRRHGDRALWVNIWEDPDAAAFVRSVNGGNETVPTVVIDGESHTNPSPTLVKAALSA